MLTGFRVSGYLHGRDALFLRCAATGNWTNVVRIVPNSAVKFLTYEQLSRCGLTLENCVPCLLTPVALIAGKKTA